MPNEVDDELRELKREVIESRGLVIKTNNLTNALAADLKGIAKRQAGYERRISWNSAISYVVFVVVVLLGVKILWDYRRENMQSDADQSKGELAALREKKAVYDKQEKAWQDLDERAARLYELVRAGNRAEFLEQLEKIQRDGLTKAELTIFGDIADRFRNELALERYSAGLEHVRFARWDEARREFDECLRINPNAAIAPAVNLALAQTLRHLHGAERDAIVILQPLADNATDHDIQASATWELAQVEVELQAWNDAKATLRNFIKKYPDHARSIDARQQLAELQLKH